MQASSCCPSGSLPYALPPDVAFATSLSLMRFCSGSLSPLANPEAFFQGLGILSSKYAGMGTKRGSYGAVRNLCFVGECGQYSPSSCASAETTKKDSCLFRKIARRACQARSGFSDVFLGRLNTRQNPVPCFNGDHEVVGAKEALKQDVQCSRSRSSLGSRRRGSCILRSGKGCKICTQIIVSLFHWFLSRWARFAKDSWRKVARKLLILMLCCFVVVRQGTVGAVAVAGKAAKTVSSLHQTESTSQQLYAAFAFLMFFVGAALGSAAETAITALYPWKVRELAEKEGPRSPFAILESDLTRFLTTILVATTSATIFSTAIATEYASNIFGATGVAYATFAMTILFLFFGEILPKALAIHSPTKVARLMVPLIRTISLILFPIGKLLASVSSFILRLFNLKVESNVAVSEQELRLIVAGADRSGSIERYESQIIKNVLDLQETYVREVMCPRVDIVAMSADSTLLDLLNEERESHYSRIPIFVSTIDNITGVVYTKSLLRYLKDDNRHTLSETPVSAISDIPLFVPESMSVWMALEEMRSRRVHMAIVVDEYGGTAGLVTLEDILEEVVGEIYDENDEDEAETDSIKELDGRTYEIDGQADLDLVGEVLGLELKDNDLKEYGTVSGFLCARKDGIPDRGDEIVVSNIRFTVVEADDRKVLLVKAKRLIQEDTESRLKVSRSSQDQQLVLEDDGVSVLRDSSVTPKEKAGGSNVKNASPESVGG